MASCRPTTACVVGFSLLVLLLSTVFPYSSLAQSTAVLLTPNTPASPATLTSPATSTPTIGLSATGARASGSGPSSTTLDPDQSSRHLAQSATAAIASSTPDTPVFSDEYASDFRLPTNTRSSSGSVLFPTDLVANPTSSSRASNDGNGDDDDNDSPSGVLNYYFLLIAIFIIIVITAYCCISRRRRRKITQLRNNGQDALAQDLEGWSGNRRWIAGRWRAGAAEPRVEEGLNERGEAPPPYMPRMPEPSHTAVGRASDGIELRDVRKPPEYEARPRSSKPDEGGVSGERVTRPASEAT